MKVALASGNAGKLAELAALLEPLGLELVSQSALGITPAREDADTFVENALKKARHVSRESGLPAIADDSGLVVDCLRGAPGVRSARYAGPDATDTDNNRKLVAALAGQHEPAAHYYCALVYLAHADDPAPLITTGRWDGTIVATPRGAGGFGYDPHFYLPGLRRTAAELPPDEKNRLSHRGRATEALCALLRNRG